MPRRPLAEISANIKRGKEITPYTRGKIISLHQQGAAKSDITEQL